MAKVLDQCDCLWNVLFVSGVHQGVDDLLTDALELNEMRTEVVLVDDSCVNEQALTAL